MASLNHSEYLLLKSPGWTSYVAGHFLLVLELRQCYICSTVDISIIFWFGTREDNDWDKFTYNRNPDGFCKSEKDMQKLLASDLQYSVLGTIFANA